LKNLMRQQTRCGVHGHECHGGLFARNLYAGQRIPLAGVAHQNGTIRFGHDPRTSALDVNCRAHEVDNLYVVDASFFVSSGAVNPALTIMANALRVGDHLLERLHARPERANSLPEPEQSMRLDREAAVKRSPAPLSTFSA
jgi:choline dehydrogenase-like flavoprotein